MTACFRAAQLDFLPLVTSLPELVESYESVDANGASVRRYMINDPASHLEAEPAFSRVTAATQPGTQELAWGSKTADSSSTPQRMPAQGDAAQSSAEVQAEARESNALSMQPSVSGREPTAEEERPTMAGATERDIAYMQRRYRDAFAFEKTGILYIFC